MIPSYHHHQQQHQQQQQKQAEIISSFNHHIDNSPFTSFVGSSSPEVDAQQALLQAEQHGLKPFDVICGKCRLAFNNVGNRRFRVVIGMNIQRYMEASTRTAKSRVIASVVKIFLDEIGATFVKQQNDGSFVPVSDKVVRQKVGHALRDVAAYCGNSKSPLPRSLSYHADKCHWRRQLSMSTINSNSTCTCNSEDSTCSDVSHYSTQSAPIISNTANNINKSTIPKMDIDYDLKRSTLQQPTKLLSNEDDWADDLSVGSMDRPVTRQDIFPLEGNAVTTNNDDFDGDFSSPLDHPITETTLLAKAEELPNWNMLDDETTDEYFYHSVHGNPK